MAVAVGIDIAKEFDWATAVDERGGELISRRVDNEPAPIQALIDDLERLQAEQGRLTIGIDLVGGIASLLAAMLVEAGFRLRHVPGLAVNRARQGTTGGEHKSDPRDARVIAEQVRTRSDLRPIETAGETDIELRLLVSRRRELVIDQTRRIGRLRDLPASIHPGLERIVEPTQKASLVLLSRSVTPAEIRHAGRARLVDHLLKAGHLPRPHVEQLAERALAAAQAQRLALPGERLAAELVRELTQEALAARDRYLQRARAGNKALKHVLYRSAFCSLSHPASRAFYTRKRREGKRHHQAVITVARRRVDVLHAILRSRQPYRADYTRAA